MKITQGRQTIIRFALLLSCVMLLNGCANLTPTDPQPPYSLPPNSPAYPADAVKVTYSYVDTGNVQLSANNLTLKVGQKLILEPTAGITQSTRFVSSGESYIGDILRQESEQNPTTRVVFTAVKAGKGKLQIIPNMTQTERATDLWVTVE